MWLLDTNVLIKFNRMDKKPLKEGFSFATIFSIIEFPSAFSYTNLSVIYPSYEHYEKAFANDVLLRERGIPIPAIDILIGTIAIDKNLILVSDDSHFNFIKKMNSDLKLINSVNYLEEFFQKI